MLGSRDQLVPQEAVYHTEMYAILRSRLPNDLVISTQVNVASTGAQRCDMAIDISPTLTSTLCNSNWYCELRNMKSNQHEDTLKNTSFLNVLIANDLFGFCRQIKLSAFDMRIKKPTSNVEKYKILLPGKERDTRQLQVKTRLKPSGP